MTPAITEQHQPQATYWVDINLTSPSQSVSTQGLLPAAGGAHLEIRDCPAPPSRRAGAGGRAPEVKLPRQSAVTPLINGVLYILVVMVLGTAGYLIAGWNMADAFYMVIITLFTVGYEEVHPIATAGLRVLTITLIVLGCTGMIYLTGAVVQFFTATQLQNLLGLKRMKNEIDHL
ncbi:MAG: potassium channel family protein [Steroidobacteraceae bacterium]